MSKSHEIVDFWRCFLEKLSEKKEEKWIFEALCRFKEMALEHHEWETKVKSSILVMLETEINKRKKDFYSSERFINVDEFG